jgi:hypothetical protein
MLTSVFVIISTALMLKYTTQTEQAWARCLHRDSLACLYSCAARLTFRVRKAEVFDHPVLRKAPSYNNPNGAGFAANYGGPA